MDNKAVSDLYQRYKIGTKRIVQWLADTAAEHCSLDSLMPSVANAAHTASTSDKNTKGKGGKKVIGNASKVFKVSVAEMTKLAKAVAARSDAKRPPPPDIDSIITIVQDVIAGRREYAIWYERSAGQQTSTQQQNTDSHKHFVDVLKLVLGELQLARQNSRPPNKKSRGRSTDKIRQLGGVTSTEQGNVISNLYNGLDVEESISTAFDENLRISAEITSPSNRPTKPVFELEATDDDKAFAIWCTLKDYHNMRFYLQSIWTEYRDGAISLAVAAQVTNEAFLLMNAAELELQERFPEIETFDHIAEYLDIRLSTVDNTLNRFSCKDDYLTNSSTITTDAADLLCIPALTVLNLVREYLRLSTGTFDPTLYYDALHHGVASHQLGRNIFSILADLRVLSISPEKRRNIQNGDAYLLDLLLLFNTGSLCLSMVAKSQVYMDIHDMVGNVDRHYFATMACVKTRIECSLTEFLQRAPQIADAETFNDSFLDSSARKLMKDYTTKGLGQPLVNADPQYGRGPFSKFNPHHFPVVANFPVLAGKLCCGLTYLKHLDGIHMCSYGYILVSMAHLYNACRLAGELQSTWPDMDFIIERHTREAFGLRDSTAAPTPMLSAARHHGLALGVELVQYAKQRSAPRPHTFIRPFLPNPSQRAPGRIAQLRSTSAYLHAAFEVDTTSKRLGFSKGRTAHAVLHRMVQRLLEGTGEALDPETRAQWTSCRKLTPIQLLTALKNQAVADEVQLNFDYHSFYVNCGLALGHIKSLCGDRITRSREQVGLYSDDYFLYEMVDEILWEAATEEAKPRNSRAKKPLLHFAAAILEEFISKHGRQTLQEALGESSGHLAAEHLPQAVKSNPDRYKSSTPGQKMSLLGDKIELQIPDDTRQELRYRSYAPLPTESFDPFAAAARAAGYEDMLEALERGLPHLGIEGRNCDYMRDVAWGVQEGSANDHVSPGEHELQASRVRTSSVSSWKPATVKDASATQAT